MSGIWNRAIFLAIIIDAANFSDRQSSRKNRANRIENLTTSIMYGHFNNPEIKSRFSDTGKKSVADFFALSKSSNTREIVDLDQFNQPYVQEIKFIKKLLRSFFDEKRRKKYFEGTEITCNPMYRNYPESMVLYFDFCRLDYTDTRALEESLAIVIKDCIGPKFKNKNFNRCNWLELLHTLFSETLGSDPKGDSLVLVVDDYPIERLRKNRSLRMARQNALILETFYETIQKYDIFIKFVLIIGVEKFDMRPKSRSSSKPIASTDNPLQNVTHQKFFKADEITCYYQEWSSDGCIENYLREHPDLSMDDIEKKEIPGTLINRKSDEPVELSKFDVHFTFYLLLVGYLTLTTYDHRRNMYGLRFRSNEMRDQLKLVRYRVLSGRQDLNLETLQSFCTNLKFDLENGMISEIFKDINNVGFELPDSNFENFNSTDSSQEYVNEGVHNKAIYDLFQFCEIPVLAMEILLSKEKKTLGDLDLMTTTFNPNYLIELKRGHHTVCLAFNKLLTYLENEEIREILQIGDNELILVGAHISNYNQTRAQIDKWLKVTFKDGQYYDAEASSADHKCFNTFTHLRKIFM